MADQVEIQLPKTKYLEQDTFPATAYFRTRATKAASTPTTIHYRVDCLRTGKVLLDWTSASAAANVELSMTSTINKIQDDSATIERKQLIVQADQGLSTQVNGRVVWQVENLDGIET